MVAMTAIASERSRITVTPGYVTPDEVATEFRTTGRTVRRWIRNGKLKAVVLPGGQLRVPIQELSSLYCHIPEAEEAHRCP